MKRIGIGFLTLALSTSLLPAQELNSEKGFELGIFRIRPEASVLGAYDDRVTIDPSGSDADGDTYGEVAAGLHLDNTDARFDVSGQALLGYRFYNEYTGLDNSFYDFGAAVASAQNPLKLGLSAYLKKTLNYDTTVGEGDLAATLTRNPSTRFSARGNVAYEKRVSDKTTITPGYDLWYYLQNFDEPGRPDDEWMEHRGGLELGYDYSKKTVFTLSGYYSLQLTEEEDGHIGTVVVGARSRVTEKTQWIAQIGVATADYELSGTGESVVSRVRATWQATEKVFVYVFGGNSFQPRSGGGGAQLVYRLGYGVNWRVVSRWSLGAQILHDYEESLTNPVGGGSDEVRHFFSAETSYNLTRQFTLSLTGRYVNDEFEVDQAVVSLGIGYRY